MCLTSQPTRTATFFIWPKCSNVSLFGSSSATPRGGDSWEFLVGVCRPVLQILTLFQTKICHYSQPFSDLASHENLYPFSDPAPKKLCHHRQRKRFLSSLFIWNWNDMFIHSRISLETHTRIPDQNGQSLYPFSDQKWRKSSTLGGGGAYTYMAFIREYPPPWSWACAKCRMWFRLTVDHDPCYVSYFQQ